VDPKTERLSIGAKQLKAVTCERFWRIRGSDLEAMFHALDHHDTFDPER
jgi:hypothetical protein